MWDLKHDIISPKLDKLLIKSWLEVFTAMETNKFYKYIKMCLNAATRLREDLLLDYQSITRHSEVEEYFNYWNAQIYNPLRQSLLVALTNDTCVIYSMAPHSYKVVNTHAHEI